MFDLFARIFNPAMDLAVLSFGMFAAEPVCIIWLSSLGWGVRVGKMETLFSPSPLPNRDLTSKAHHRPCGAEQVLTTSGAMAISGCRGKVARREAPPYPTCTVTDTHLPIA